MLQNYLTTAFRNLKKFPVYSVINITGLAIGITFFVLLTTYVRDEMTYDRFHPQADHIYMVTAGMHGRDAVASSSPMLAQVLTDEYPGIGRTVRFWKNTLPVQRADNINTQDVAFADPAFFEMFAFPLQLGSAAQALSKPSQIVLTPAMAQKYFGGSDPMGKIISIRLGQEKHDFMVSGVLQELPSNSSIRFDMLISFSHVKTVFGQDFADSLITTPFFHCTFLDIRELSRVAAISDDLAAFVKRKYGAEFKEFNLDTGLVVLGLHKFTDYHLGAVGGASLEARSRPLYSLILFGIAVTVLLLACINYVNLAIGRSSTRFKEIATRKVVGAARRQLIIQFLTDSLIISLPAFFLGLLLAGGLLPRFNYLTGKSLSLGFMTDWQSLLFLSGLYFVVGIGAGCYPAIILSRLEAVNIFRGTSQLGGHNLFTRSLIVLQFSISIFLLTGVLLMTRQLEFIRTKDLGYNPHKVISIPTYSFWFGDRSGEKTLDHLNQELSTTNGIIALAGTSGWDSNPMAWSNVSRLIWKEEQVRVQFKRIDYDFLETMQIPLLQGRNFSPEFSTDSRDAVIVNQAFIKRFRLTDPIGMNLAEFATDTRPEGYRFHPTIIGVVEDVIFSSLHREIEPAAFYLSWGGRDETASFSHILVRLDPDNRPAALAALQNKWAEINPDKPFLPSYLDDILIRQYGLEQRWSGLVSYSAGFALLIACLGIFGLTTLSLSRRSKEISIRRILGAGKSHMLGLLSREYILLVASSSLAAWPLAYLAGNRWLQNFAFRININLSVFIFSSMAAVVITTVTISLQTLRLLQSDPVRHLRRE